MGQMRRVWTEEDKAMILGLAGKVPLQELARQLDRTEAATRVQASKLGITAVRTDDAGRAVQPAPPQADAVEKVVAPVAIERALSIYQQLQGRDQSVLLQARKILTQHIYGMVDRGECDEQRLTVGGLVHLKAVERDHAIKSAHTGPSKSQRGKATA
jgi:hypothetical protein